MTKKVLLCLCMFLMLFSVSAYADDSFFLNFDSISDKSEIKMKPGSGLSLENVNLDSSIHKGESGKSIKVTERVSHDYRLKFENAIPDLTPGTKYYISMWLTVNNNSFAEQGYFYVGVYSPEKGKYRAIYNNDDKDAKCKQLIGKDKWTKIGFLYTVSDSEANMVGVEQVNFGGFSDTVDFNVDDVSVIKVDDNFTITDLPSTEAREYTPADKNYDKFPQIGVIKLDDLRPNDAAFDKFDRIKGILDKYGVKAGFGVIGQGFESCDEKYYDKIKEWNNDGIEIWHHGYYHSTDEYSKNPYEKQLEDFAKTHNIIKEKTGIELVTFGSPYNNAGSVFVEMINKEFPSYETLLLVNIGNQKSDKLHFTKRINVESDTGKVSFDLFKEGYNRIAESFVMQAHPPYFSDESFENFENVVKYCLDNNVVLMTPHQYYEYEKSIKLIVDKEKLLLDVYPVIKNDRTLVPLRAIFEKLGANVSWDENTKTVTASKDGVQISLTIDSDTAVINGTETKLDVPACVIDGRTLVPVRFVSESLGKEVLWDEENNYVIVK